MQGPIVQTIGLVFAANARRRGIVYPGLQSSSIMQFCNKIDFVGRKRKDRFGLSRPIEVADPDAWLDTLPDDMVSARLCVLPRHDPDISDRMTVGFVNGGPIFLAQIVAATPERWYGEWQVTNQDAPDRRIWSVTYHNVPDTSVGIQPGSQQQVREALAQALDDAIAFTDSNDMGFREIFLEAKKALNDQSPMRDFYLGDIISEGLLSLSDLQLFSCATKAWVFGGMGSWNDAVFVGAKEDAYAELSDRLFWAIIDGLVLAINASASA